MTRLRRNSLFAWLGALLTWVVASRIEQALGPENPAVFLFSLGSFLARLAFFAISLYWLAIGTRWILRKLFWRVGRRLALSYFLIGVLPFLLFAVLLLCTGYAIGGLLSQAAYRAERQWFLARMDQWNLEWATGAERPASALPTLRIYDSSRGETKALPKWLSSQAFTGIVASEHELALVSSRLYGNREGRRSVVFVQPLDDAWARYVEEKNSMIVSYSASRQRKTAKVGAAEIQVSDAGADTEPNDSTSRVSIAGQNGGGFEADVDDQVFNDFFKRTASWNGVVWADLSPPLVEWSSGEIDSERRVFTLIWNPWSAIVESFFFGSSEYARGVLAVIGGVASALLLIYLPASLFAAVLIFSISRAVNRIEKGTLAVERGDFTYRIGLKPQSQLGQMAVSFDRMTESISTLLVKVAEKERLQSEIDIAASIQRNLLPSKGPDFGGVSFSAHFEPTEQIGGDYYDVFNLDNRRLAVAIGDVSGHGLSTGLVMAMVKAAMTTLVEEGADEASLFRRLNELVHRSTERRAFMTLGFTIFDLDRATMRHTNAGHLYPYLLRSGQPPYALECPSLPLGVRHDVDPHTIEEELRAGDTIVYLSDGIVEAQNPDGDPQGFDQVEAILARFSDGSPAEIQEAVLEATTAHSGSRVADDDRTVMVLRFDSLAPVPPKPVAVPDDVLIGSRP